MEEMIDASHERTGSHQQPDPKFGPLVGTEPSWGEGRASQILFGQCLVAGQDSAAEGAETAHFETAMGTVPRTMEWINKRRCLGLRMRVLCGFGR